RRRHTRLVSDWSSDVCSSDLAVLELLALRAVADLGAHGEDSPRARMVRGRDVGHGDVHATRLADPVQLRHRLGAGPGPPEIGGGDRKGAWRGEGGSVAGRGAR